RSRLCLGHCSRTNDHSWLCIHLCLLHIFPNSVYDDGTGKYVTNTDVYTTNYGRLFWNSDLNTNVISNYLADGSFWKLREVAISYDIPTKVFGSKISSVIKN